MSFVPITSNEQTLLPQNRRRGRTFCAAPALSHNDWVKAATLSPWLNLTPQSLQAMRRNGTGPAFARLSRTDVRYRHGDVVAWIVGLVVDPASYAGKRGITLAAPIKLQIDKRSLDLLQWTPGQNPNDLFTQGQVGSCWGISQSLLERARHVGYGPKYLKTSRNRVMYRRDDLLDYLRARAAIYVREYSNEAGVA